jgi:hypothetical protein
MTYTWHPTRDDRGEVLGEYDAELDGYPWITTGITLAEARRRFGDVAQCGAIPVTIPADR